MQTHDKDGIEIIHQGKKVADFWSNSLRHSLSYSYMEPIFDYLNRDKKNKLHFEQYGDLAEGQLFETTTLRELEKSWGAKYDELKAQAPKDRDKNAYCKNLFWTFRGEMSLTIALRMVQMLIEFTGINFTTQFFAYLESEDAYTIILPEDSGYWETAQWYMRNYRGLTILAGIMLVEWPKGMFQQIFDKVVANFTGKIVYAQKIIIFDKYSRVSSATNKTISPQKFMNILDYGSGSFEELAWQVAECIKAVFILFFCTHQLFEMVGWAILVLPLCMYTKMQFANFTLKWRERGWRKESRLREKRKAEIDMAIRNIKTVKLYAWQNFFQSKIEGWRDREETIKYESTVRNWLSSLVTRTIEESTRPLLFTVAMTLCNKTITMSNVFTTIMMIEMLSGPMQFLPYITESLHRINRQMRRIQTFLFLDEIQDDQIDVREAGWNKPALTVKGNFTWGLINKQEDVDSEEEEQKVDEKEEKQTLASKIQLKNLDIEVKQGELVCIVGEIGSGKSSLLNAIFGEMAHVSDKFVEKVGGMDSTHTGADYLKLQRDMLAEPIEPPIVRRGTVSYVEQQSWLQNATVRDNILFDLPLDEERYVKTIMACCLEPDLEILKSGDLTEIGERGINLSGGQKARISLARAVYAQKDIVLMDDPISALDAHVRKQIFRRVFCGLLKGKTRILATHAIEFLHLADKVIVMHQGEVKTQGSYEEVLEHPIVKKIVKIHNKHKREKKEVTEGYESASSGISLQNIEIGTSSADETIDVATPLLKPKKRVEAPAINVKEKMAQFSRHMKKESGALIKDNDTEKQELDPQVVMKAVNIIGGKLFWLLMLSSYLAQSLWGKYTEYKLKNMASVQSKPDMPEEDISAHTDILSFVYNTWGQMVLDIGRTFVTMFVGARLSKKMFDLALGKVMNAPVNLYFDITPMSKVTGYFTGDMNNCDSHLWRALQWLTRILVDSVSKISIAVYFSPPLAAMALLSSYVMHRLGEYTKIGKQEVQRVSTLMNTRMNTHIYQQIQSLEGMTIMRAYNRQATVRSKYIECINSQRLTRYINRAAYSYYETRVNQISNLMFLSVAVTCIHLKGTLSPIYLALMFQNLKSIHHCVQEMLSGYGEIKRNFLQLQRILNLEDMPEEQATIGGKVRAENWPQEGAISFKDVHLRYRPGTDLVLNGLTFDIEPGQKIGIVGRTGAGKSTLALALSRIIECEKGQIQIDGLATANIDLQQVRGNITVIPQEPVIFPETIKFNLDPSGKIPDGQMEDLLRLAGLDRLLELKPETKKKEDEYFFDDIDSAENHGINFKLNDGGNSLSMGEKQLLCICRAVLRRNKIIILDEATANIDIVTEQKIYKLIESAFAESTVLTIAHRLNTVLSSDKVLVIDKGKVVEFDSPKVLARDPNSRLTYLLQDIEKDD